MTIELGTMNVILVDVVVTEMIRNVQVDARTRATSTTTMPEVPLVVAATKVQPLVIVVLVVVPPSRMSRRPMLTMLNVRVR